MGPIERELRQADWSGPWLLSLEAMYFVSEVAWREFEVVCRLPCGPCIALLRDHDLLGDLASYSIEAAEALNV